LILTMMQQRKPVGLQPTGLTRGEAPGVAVIEMSQSSWLVAGMLPGIERQPRKKLEPSPERLLALLQRWQDETVRAGRTITRIALAFEASRDGFWLARWLNARGVDGFTTSCGTLSAT
jgi:transposase